MVRSLFSAVAAATLLPAALAALTAGDIQGPAFLSPYNGQTVHNVTGIVTAKGPSGFWIQSPLTNDLRYSQGLSVFTTTKTILGNVTVGDSISLSGHVFEFHSSSDPDDLKVTELESPANITILSQGNTVKPIILGKDRSPPTEYYTALDNGPDGWLSVPNNMSRIETVNATLQPAVYGIDFWESLEGMLVTVKKPTALNFENQFGEIWVYGNWPVTGLNSRGGLSLTFNDQNIPDANPETIIIGAPLDGTKNPTAATGMVFEDITGVVTYQFGFYYILPTTALVVKSTPKYNPKKTSLPPVNSPCTITIGDYNIDNFAPTSKTLSNVSEHIALYLKNPDIVFLQEVQDNSGPTDDGTVDATTTLTNIVHAITAASIAAGLKPVNYSFLEIAPINDQDGGEPGGNIRVAYLYNSLKVRLAGETVIGDATTATAPFKKSGDVGLTLNPGLVDPTNAAWEATRKPLAAVWESNLDSSTGDRFFTINVHLSSKDGSESTVSNSRPPVNGVVDKRTEQVAIVGNFVQSILALNKQANVIVAGDHNEFIQTRSVYTGYANILTDIDEVAEIDPVERYTYVFDYQNEQLDHIFISNALKKRGAEAEHVHVNNWSLNFDWRSSDHDPTVARLQIC